MFHWSDIIRIPYHLGNSDKSNAMNAINNQKTAVGTQSNNLGNQFQNQLNSGSQLDSSLANNIATGYANFNPNVTQGEINDLWQGGGASGGIDPNQITSAFDSSTPGFQKFATNGGLTPQFNSAFNANMNTVGNAENEFQNINTNPVSASDANTMLANGTFQKFIDTGGFSPTDIQDIRARAISPTISAYSDAQRQMLQNNRISNGFATNTPAALAEMARDESNQISNSDIAANSNIAQEVQQGKEFGASGMSAAGSNLANLNLEGRISGATGQAQSALAAQSAETAVQQLDDEMKMSGLQGLSDQEKTQLQAELQNAQINEQASATNAALQAQKAEAQFAAETNVPKLELAGLEGETQALGTTPAAQQAASNNLLNLFNGTNTAQNNLINSEIGASKIPSGFQSALGNIGSILGLLGNGAAAATGLSSIGSLFGSGGNASNDMLDYVS